MATQHSTDFRESLLAALDAGLSISEAVTFFEVSVSTIGRWRKLKETTGSAAPRPGRGRRSQLAGDGDAALLRLVAERPETTLPELAERLAEETGLRVSPSTLSRRVQRLGITRKKGRWLPANKMPRSGRPGEPRSLILIPPI